jgi:hypothetical protein
MRAITVNPAPSQSALQSLLTAPILPSLLRFALPNMVAMLATALATVAETAYVGRIGVPSLAGMALVFPMVMLQMMLSGGAMGGGVASAISRAPGAGAAERANALAVHALWIGLAAGGLNCLLMLLWGPAIYAGLGGRGEALAQAIAYSTSPSARGPSSCSDTCAVPGPGSVFPSAARRCNAHCSPTFSRWGRWPASRRCRPF